MFIKKEKTYIVVNLTETDGECYIRRLTGEQIRNLEKSDKLYCSVIEGNVLKGFNNETFDFKSI
jgi:hypothetical protein